MAVSKRLVIGVKIDLARQLLQNVALFRLGLLIAIVFHGLRPDHEVQHGDAGLLGKKRLPLDAA